MATVRNITYADLDRTVLNGMSRPGRSFYILLAVSFTGILVGGACWGYQIYVGLGAAGIAHPVMWGTYLINFVFWIEIGHAGSLMSALLYLVRAGWRNPIARSAEAMTIFAVSIAALFPYIHLGRSWIFYWLIPYPNQRDLWPNFVSPLIFDFWAIAGYLTISLAFWYVGLIPDFAIIRDHSTGLKRKIYGLLAAGWSPSHSQWRPYKAAYMLFAGIVTAFVPCVASIVSWDYALTIVPGYHSTIWGPYFLIGAVHSGLAMLLTLLVPLRKIYGFEDIITPKVLENVAKLLIVMALLLGYTYFVEHFLGWYSGKTPERMTFMLRTIGYYAPVFWGVVVSAEIIPLIFIVKRIRRNPVWLFVIAIVVNIGMWLERFVIIVGPLTHGYVPYAWGNFWPSPVEWGILAGSFSLFTFLFLLYSKFVPTISMTEMKELLPAPSRGSSFNSALGDAGVKEE